MSGLIPKQWPDVEAWFIGWVTSAKLNAAGVAGTVKVRNQKPADVGPYKQVIIAADYGQLITPISRYVRIRMEAWVVLANGTTDLKGSFDLANAAAFIAAQAARNGAPIISVEIDAGPSRVKDTLSGIEYNATTLLLEVGAI